MHFRSIWTTIQAEHSAMVAVMRERDAETADAQARSHADPGRQRIQDVLARGVNSMLDISLDSSPAVLD